MSEYYKDKKVLVTGGAGFIGSHLVELLVLAGAKVRVADNLSNGSLDNLANVIDKIEFLELDLRKESNCRLAVKNQEIVFNLAAKVANIGYNRAHPLEMFEDNILLQMYPIKAAYEQGVEKFLQASTVCVYPHDAIIPTPESEGERGRPEDTNEGYGWAKRMGEVLARLYHDKGMATVVSRFSNVYGPRDHFNLEIAHVIPAFIVKCLTAREIKVWGTGEQTRSFLYVKDAALALLKLMELYVKPEPVNSGGGKMVSMKDLLRMILEETQSNDVKISWDTSYPDGHKQRQADDRKMRQITGWIPETALKAGISAAVKWYKENLLGK